MADPFVAEIRIVPFNFAPTGWAACDGQILPIAQNTALFSLIGITFGGDGKSTFALPDLRGRSPLHPGTGNGLSPHQYGEAGGAAAVALTGDQLPPHGHTLSADGGAATTGTPGAALAAANTKIYNAAQNLVPLAPLGEPAQPHNNMQPYLTCNFCIALQGVFPPRS